MKYGIHYAYWETQWVADIEADCRRAARLGFSALEISGDALLGYSIPQLKQLQKTAEDCKLELNPCQGMPEHCDPGSDDRATRQRGIDFADRMFDAMGYAGCKQLGGILYSYWPALHFSGNSRDIGRAKENSLKTMSVISESAKKRNITLMLEVVNRYENFMFNDVRGALAYLDALGQENVKLLLDVFHMNIEEDDMAAAIRLAGKKLGHFHIGECNRRVPGKGHMPWDAISDGLKAIGYDGVVAMEPFVRADGQVADAIRVWRNLDPEETLDEELSAALHFIRRKLETQNA